MSITTLDGLLAASRKKYTIQKASLAAKAASAYASLWKVAGIPAAGATPPTGSGEAPTKATIGAVPFSEIGGGAAIYLGRFAASGATAGTLILYDRLVHTSGLSGVDTASQSVNTAALTRWTDGVGVEAFLETYTATGSTARDITITYTDETGATGQTVTFAHQVSAVIGQMQAIPGIKGCRSVQSVQLSGSTGTAGDFGITLAKRIAEIPIRTDIGEVQGPFSLGLPLVVSNACLALMVLASTTNTGLISGSSLDIVQG